MLRIPVDILTQYDTVLKTRAVPLYLRANYTKWLQYYLRIEIQYCVPGIRILEFSHVRCAARLCDVLHLVRVVAARRRRGEGLSILVVQRDCFLYN